MNVGNVDKIFRFIIGSVAIGAGIYYSSWWGALGLIPIVTALVGRCPAYMPFGISTCSVKEEKQK